MGLYGRKDFFLRSLYGHGILVRLLKGFVRVKCGGLYTIHYQGSSASTFLSYVKGHVCKVYGLVRKVLWEVHLYLRVYRSAFSGYYLIVVYPAKFRGLLRFQRSFFVRMLCRSIYVIYGVVCYDCGGNVSTLGVIDHFLAYNYRLASFKNGRYGSFSYVPNANDLGKYIWYGRIYLTYGVWSIIYRVICLVSAITILGYLARRKGGIVCFYAHYVRVFAYDVFRYLYVLFRFFYVLVSFGHFLYG